MDSELTFKTANGYLFTSQKEIVRVEADRNFTLLYVFYQVKPYKIMMNISKFEIEYQNKLHLFKCHRSHLVNLSYVMQFYEKSKVLKTQNGEIPISISYLRSFKMIKCLTR